jgi:hypothetical protein
MSGFNHTLALSAGMFAMLAAPASAATVRHVDCFVLAVGVGGLFSSPTPQIFATVTNNLSSTIPAGTTFNLTVEGRQSTYKSTAALAPGDRFNQQVPFTEHSGACDATFRDGRLITDKLNNLTLKRGTLKAN